MDTLVKLFDKNERIHNILSVHCFLPKQVVYLVDFTEDGADCMNGIRKALSRTHPETRVDIIGVCYQNKNSVEQALLKISGEFLNPVFDISGGNNAASSHVSCYCSAHHHPIFIIHPESGQFLDMGGAQIYKDAFSMPKLCLEDFIEPTGALISGNIHSCPNERWHDNILKFARLTMKNSRNWQRFCFFLQEVTDDRNRDAQSRVYVEAPLKIQRGHKTFSLDMEFSRLAARFGFIDRFYVEAGKVHFSYSSDTFRRYLTSQGVWLEMFLYISAKRFGFFDDCRMSVIIDWNGILNEDGNVMNEIDVILIKGITPIFISCKTSCPTTDDLNEIELYAKRFGGNQAIAAVVTSALSKRVPLSVKNRAEEMDVFLLTKESLCMRELSKIFEKITDRLAD